MRQIGSGTSGLVRLRLFPDLWIWELGAGIYVDLELVGAGFLECLGVELTPAVEPDDS